MQTMAMHREEFNKTFGLQKVETEEQKNERIQKRKCETNQIIMGPCDDYQEMYFYDHFINDCRHFIWGGDQCKQYKYAVEEDHLQNRFEDKEECQKYCI